MLDEKKIRIMTKLSVYEKHNGRYDMKLAKFFSSDYVHYHVLRTLIAVSFGYFLLLFMAAVYKSDYLIAEAIGLDWGLLGRRVLAIYLIILVVFAVISIIGYNIAYHVSHKRLAGYYNLLKKLKKYYRKQHEAEKKAEEASKESGRNAAC